MDQMEQIDYENELNHRLDNRWAPSAPLKPLFEARPIGTKYTWFQGSDAPLRSTVPLYTYKEATFNPGRGPIEGFMKTVDIESKLRLNSWPYRNQIRQPISPVSRVICTNFPGQSLPRTRPWLIFLPESRRPI